MNKKGFTLIELLGVILIISLLVIIVLPRITNSVNNFSTKTDKLMMNMIEDAAKLYVEDNPYDFKKENGRNYCILISRLVNEDYLKNNIKLNGESITNKKALKVVYNDGFEYELVDLPNESCTLINYVKNLYNPTTTSIVNGIEYSLDKTHKLMNDRLGSSTVGKTEGNIRYYGANPNNYIDIGDRDSEGNIIFWRIIGLFKDIEVTDENDNVIKTEDLVKIIRANKLVSEDIDGFSWDYTSSGTYDNSWNDSTLQIMLNDEVNGYYGSGTTSYYNNSTTPTTLDFQSTGLSSSSHNRIEKVKWMLGGHNNQARYTDAMYRYERAVGAATWSGKITLMNISDYGYSADLSSCQTTLNSYDETACTSTNWLYDSTKTQWTLISNSSSENVVFAVNLAGRLNLYNENSTHTVRPVLYLKSDVGIVEEKETSEGLKYLVVE